MFRKYVPIACLLVAPFVSMPHGEELAAKYDSYVKIVNPWPDAGDSFGQAVASGAGVVAVGSPGDDAYGMDAGVVHVFRRDLLLDTLVGSDSQAGDRFGASIAMDAQLLIVGAPGFEGTGSAYVFALGETGRWQETARLEPASPDEVRGFGTSVAVDRDTIVVGAPLESAGGNFSGAVYVFERSGQIWKQAARLTLGGASGLIFGSSVAVEGDVVVAGAPYLGLEYSPGTAWVFTRAEDGWRLHQRLYSPYQSGRDRFGRSAAISNGWIAVGAPRDGLPPFGYLAVFQPSAAPGEGTKLWDVNWADISPQPSTLDHFGQAVDLSGRLLLGGAPLAGDSGKAFLYRFQPEGWTVESVLEPQESSSGDQFGASVAIGPANIVVGAPGDDSTVVDAGAVYLY